MKWKGGETYCWTVPIWIIVSYAKSPLSNPFKPCSNTWICGSNGRDNLRGVKGNNDSWCCIQCCPSHIRLGMIGNRPATCPSWQSILFKLANPYPKWNLDSTPTCPSQYNVRGWLYPICIYTYMEHMSEQLPWHIWLHNINRKNCRTLNMPKLTINDIQVGKSFTNPYKDS